MDPAQPTADPRRPAAPIAPADPDPAGVFLAGARAAVPMMLGVFPFGMVSGAVAAATGLSPVEALGMSLAVYAGASQLAAVQLYGAGAPPWLIVLTAAVVNLRFTMYSAAIAPYFRHLSWRRKALYSYLLTDQAFAFATHYYDRLSRPVREGWYYLGVALSLCATWQAGTALGVFLGARAPESGILGFMIPLVFLSLLIPALENRAAVAAAVTSGAVAVLAAGLPMNLGLMTAALAGIVVGLAAEGRRAR